MNEGHKPSFYTIQSIFVQVCFELETKNLIFFSTKSIKTKWKEIENANEKSKKRNSPARI